MGMMMNRRWKAHASEHPPAPGNAHVFFQVFQNKQGGAYFELLHDLRRVGLNRGPNQQVKVFGHQDIPNDLEPEFASQIVQSPDPPAFKPLRVEQRGASISAAGQVVKMVQSVKVSLPGHAVSLPLLKAAYIP